MECVIDTNVLVYDMMEDAELHPKAKEGLDNVSMRVIPVTVIEELAHVLVELNVGRDTIRQKLEEILGYGSIASANPINIQSAIDILEKEKISFDRLNDKLILSLAKEKNLPLFTFDRELIKECKANSVRLFQV